MSLRPSVRDWAERELCCLFWSERPFLRRRDVPRAPYPTAPVPDGGKMRLERVPRPPTKPVDRRTGRISRRGGARVFARRIDVPTGIVPQFPRRSAHQQVRQFADAVDHQVEGSWRRLGLHDPALPVLELPGHVASPQTTARGSREIRRVGGDGPLRDGRAWPGAGVRKPPKEETAGRKGRPFGRARPMEISGSRTSRVCRRGGRWRGILAAETMMTSEFGREDARPWRGRGGRGRTDDLERTSASCSGGRVGRRR